MNTNLMNELNALLKRLPPTRAGERAAYYVRVLYLFEKTDAEAAKLIAFKDTSRDQRYQWKKRVLDALWPHASPELRHFLKHRGPIAMPRR